MGRKNKQNDFEVIIPMDDERTKILKDNDVLNRLNNLEFYHASAYTDLVKWVYKEFKSAIPGYNPKLVDVPLMSALKAIPSDKFDTFLNMLDLCEDTDKGCEVEENDKNTLTTEEKWNELISDNYISFSISRYALTDVIEELYNSNAKDIIVTKEDDNLVVKYKPSWRK